MPTPTTNTFRPIAAPPCLAPSVGADATDGETCVQACMCCHEHLVSARVIDEPDLFRGYDPFAEDVIADPYPWYRMLLAEGGAHRSAARDVWVLSRYDDVREAARSHESLSSAEGVAYQRIPLPMMLTSDQPGHTRLRRMASRDFTPRAV